jgi:hypothetical protein
MGLERDFLKKKLVGGAAILTFGLWSPKVSNSFNDESGNGTFAVTTIQGKYNQCISLISTCITVKKGTDIGLNSVYAQQVTLHEAQRLKLNRPPQKTFVPESMQSND